MTANPLVSILIPAFNAGRFLGETLASVRGQTYPHYETIIVDDGSTDDSAETALKFVSQDNRFQLVRQANRGLAVTRNQAFGRSCGELIAFLDADDVWFPEKLERQVEVFRQDPAANLAYTNYHLWDGVNDLGLRYAKPGHFPARQPRSQLIYACPFGMSSVVVRRELLARAGGFDETLPAVEDWDLWLRLMEIGLESRGLPEPLFRYRLHPGNMSKNRVMMCEQVVRVLEKNRAGTRFPEHLPHYRRSVQAARANLVLARARQLLETNPRLVTPALWRAWCLNPRQPKWLLRWLCAAWPKALGGTATSAYAHRKLREKF